MDTPCGFHPGELRAQEQAGMREKMEKIGSIALRDHMPEQHREFFTLLPTLFIGGGAADGSLWASMLWHTAGFVQSPDPATLRVSARLRSDDPLASALQPGWQLGCLGLQFESRRRNRANGRVDAADAQGFTIGVQQSFGNCAKYIQTRELVRQTPQEQAGATIAGGAQLPVAAVELIAQADTFFIASAAGAAGADVSHRGGKPGFVCVERDGTLAWPDFQGNYFFNTIGNLLLDARAGLLFIDFERGDLLHLSGCAEVTWGGEHAERFPGAHRFMHFRTERHVFRPHAFPLRWKLSEYSPYLDGTGSRDANTAAAGQ